MDHLLATFAELRRPPIVIAAISVFAVISGTTLSTQTDTAIKHQQFVGIPLLVAGLVGITLALHRPRSLFAARFTLAAVGSIIAVGFALRGASLWLTLGFGRTDDSQSYYLVEGGQWFALAYMTSVAWFDVAQPWVLSRQR